MSVQDRCVEIYARNQDISEVAAESGLPWHIAYINLKRAKVLNIETRMVSGSKSDRMGAFYESEFLKIVPSAISNNDRRKQAAFDFWVGNFKVEVKSSSLYFSPSGRKHWKFQVMTRRTKMRTADFYVCFGRNHNENIKDYSIFCFPAEVLLGGNVNVSLDGGNEWANFLITSDDLCAFFDTLVADN